MTNKLGVKYMFTNEKKVIFPLILSTIIVLFNFRVFFYFSGLLAWQNFVEPLNTHYAYYFFWNPYFGGGTPNLTPLSTMESRSVIWFFQQILSQIIGYNNSIKLYIFLSIFFMGYSFYILTREFISKMFSRILSSVFFVLNPVMMTMIAFGDYPSLISMGFFIVGLSFLIKFAKKHDSSSNLFLLVTSYTCLMLSLPFEMIFYIGIFLYPIFGVFFLRRKIKLDSWQWIAYVIRFTFENIYVLLVISLVFTLPFFLASNISVSPSGPVARTLVFYLDRSLSMKRLLFLAGTGPLAMNSVASINSIVAFSWYWSIIILIVGMFIYTIYSTNRTLIFFTILLVVALLLGSGGKSPISILNLWLYTHVPGYQVFPESYLWDEVLIAPIISLMIGIVLDAISSHKVSQNFRFKIRNFVFTDKHKYSKFVYISIAALVIFSSFTPMVAQGYYGPNGTNNASSIMTRYNPLYDMLATNLSKTDYGVAFFPGDPYVYYGNNTSNYLINPLINKPDYRVLNYASGIPAQSSYYFWLYNEFYDNNTQYAAQLFGAVGVKYFVVLDGFNSVSYGDLGNGKNVSRLMSYQKNIVQLYSGENYTVFESTLNMSQVYSVHNFTLVLGGYDTLNYAAYNGFNIVRNTNLFASDLNKDNFDTLIPMISNIYVQNFTELRNLTNNAFGINSELSMKWYDYLYEEIVNRKIDLTEFISPRNIKLTSHDMAIGDSYGYYAGNTFPQGEYLHIQSYGDNVTNVSINAGFGSGYLYMGLQGGSGGVFSINSNSSELGYSPLNYSSNAIGWLLIPPTMIGQSNFLNITLDPKSHSIVQEFIYSNSNLSIGGVKGLSEIPFKTYPYGTPLNYTEAYNSSMLSLDGSFKFDGNYPIELVSNFSLNNTKGLLISYNISDQVIVDINGLTISGTSNGGYLLITHALLALTADFSDHNLFISFQPPSGKINTNTSINFSINFIGKTQFEAPMILSEGNTPLNSSLIYSQTGYTLKNLPTGYVTYYEPYYKQIDLSAGHAYSALGGLNSIIYSTGGSVTVTFQNFNYTIYGFIGSFLGVSALFILRKINAYKYQKKTM